MMQKTFQKSAVGRYITPQEAERLHGSSGVTVANIYLWIKGPCDALGGRKLRFKPGPNKRQRWLIHVRDCKRISRWWDSHKPVAEFTDARGTWVIIHEAAKDFPGGKKNLEHWTRHPCLYLGGRKLACQRRTVVGPGRHVRLYVLAEEVQKVQNGIAESQRMANDENLLTVEQVESEFSVKSSQLQTCIDNGKLSPQKVLFPSGLHMVHRNLFSREEVAVALATLPDATKPFVDEGGTWYTAKAAGIHYGKAKVPIVTIAQWHRAGQLKRLEGGPPAKSVTMRCGKVERDVRVYHQEAIDSFIAEREQNLLPDPLHWTPTAETKWGLGILKKWRAMGCPILGGEKLEYRRALVSFSSPRGRRTIAHCYWKRSQLERIEKKLVGSIKEAYLDEEKKRWLPRRLAIEESGIPQTPLDRYRKKGYVAANGERFDLRSQKVYLRLSLNRYRKVFVFNANDLTAIKAARLDSKSSAPRADARYILAAEARNYGVTDEELSFYARQGCVFLGGERLHRAPFRGKWHGGGFRGVKPKWQYSRAQFFQIVKERYHKMDIPSEAQGNGSGLAAGQRPEGEAAAATPQVGAGKGEARQADRAEAQTTATANEDRDKWIYEQCCKMERYDRIAARLSKRKNWAAIASPQGIKVAAARYADRHELPPIPSRQPGRPS